MDLKHLKLRKECVKIAQHALLNDQGSVKSGIKNALLKMYESLTKVSKKPKPKKTIKKKACENENKLETQNDLLNQMVVEMNTQIAKMTQLPRAT